MPRRKIIAIVAGLLLVGGGIGGWAVWKQRYSDPVGREVRAAQRELKTLPKGSAERAAAWDRHRDRVYELVLARHPELAVTYKDVPDEENGFRKWLEFDAKHGEKGPDPFKIPDEIEHMLDREKWDSDLANRWLKEHATLVDEVEAIGLLPEQSTKGVNVPAMAYVPMSFTFRCSNLMLLRARLMAEQGKPEEALRSVRAAMGLANHFDQIEIPGLLLTTSAATIRIRVIVWCFDSIFPIFPKDLKDWENVLREPLFSPETLAVGIRGEWHIMLHDVMPMVLLSEECPPDPGKFLAAWSTGMIERIHACQSTDWRDLTQKIAKVRASGSGLSPASIKFLSVSEIGAESWAKSWVHAHLRYQQKNAAFAHLRGEPLPIESITGKPFVWDEASQSIRFAEDERLKEFNLKPLVVRPRGR